MVSGVARSEQEKYIRRRMMPWRYACGLGTILPSLTSFNGHVASLLTGSTTTNIVSGAFTAGYGVVRYIQWREIRDLRKAKAKRHVVLPMPPPGFEGEWDWDQAVAIAFGDQADSE